MKAIENSLTLGINSQSHELLTHIQFISYCVLRNCTAHKTTLTDLRNLSTFSLACLFYFTVHRCTKLFGPKIK